MDSSVRPYRGEVTADVPARPSTAVEDYLKVIFSLAERSGDAVTTSRLAERLGVSASSASGMVRRLGESGLVEHRRYGEITLTEQGRTTALSVVRRHRLLETYLAHELGFAWHEVHEEAEVLEHAVSDRLLARMDARLGGPRFDPHGDPIPQPDGTLPDVRARRLTEVPDGTAGTLVRVDDTDPAMLRHLADLGVRLGVALERRARRPFDGPYAVAVDGVEHELGPALAAALWLG